MVFCEKCGAENPDEADVCEVCDTRLKKPLRLFKKRGKKAEEEEEKEEVELPVADAVRGMDVQSLAPSGVKGAVSRLIALLEDSGLSDYETEETKKPTKETRDLIEAIDSKVMELEMKLKKPLEPPTIYMLLGNTYFNTGEMSRAERFYEKAVEQDGNYAESLLRVAKRYRASKEPDRAMAVVEKLLAKSPKHVEALYQKALLLKEKGDLKDALKFIND
jgi:tetratricopeptide (TPR) repeat protein